MARPSIGVLRAPAVVSGLLAILVIYAFGTKVLDRPTAGFLAAVVLATLPGAIVYGRIGHEYCQMPLVGALAICFALKASTNGLALTMAASLLVHPLNVFLVPIALPIYLTQLIRTHAHNRANLLRLLGWVTGAGSLAVGLAAYWLWSRPVVRATVSQREALDWRLFFRGFETFMLHAYNPLPGPEIPRPGWLLRAEPWSVLVRSRSGFGFRHHRHGTAPPVGTACAHRGADAFAHSVSCSCRTEQARPASYQSLRRHLHRAGRDGVREPCYRRARKLATWQQSRAGARERGVQLRAQGGRAGDWRPLY